MPAPDIPTLNDLTEFAIFAAYGLAAYLLFQFARYLKYSYYDWQIGRSTDAAGMIDREELRDLQWRRGARPAVLSPIELLKTAGMMVASILINGIVLPWLLDLMADGTGLSPLATIGTMFVVMLAWTGFDIRGKGPEENPDQWDLANWKQRYRSSWVGAAALAGLIVFFNWP